MSMKVSWDADEERLLAKCEVLAAWQGLSIERRGRAWSIVLLDGPRVVLEEGLSLIQVEAFLLGANEQRPRRARRLKPAVA